MQIVNRGASSCPTLGDIKNLMFVAFTNSLAGACVG